MNYLTDQLITYLGNKRSLLNTIDQGLLKIEEECPIYSIIDLFSGSGVVSRFFKTKGYNVIANDQELYSYIINDCYLTNQSNFDEQLWEKYYQEIINYPIEENGIISRLYAPQDTNNILKDERVFYTHENAVRLDTYSKAIRDICPESFQKFFLAPLFSEASIHVNTSGVFKGFYKDSHTGIGKFGGTKGNALERIKGAITLNKPILINGKDAAIYQQDANLLAKKLKADVAYLDPPYNQHPYGSNYFMLNILAENRVSENISRVAGIPSDWKRSLYNSRPNIYKTMDDVISSLQVKYILLSYNSEGFLSYDDIISILEKYGEVFVFSTQYNTFRGSRNLRDRDIHVTEYLFLLKKSMI